MEGKWEKASSEKGLYINIPMNPSVGDSLRLTTEGCENWRDYCMCAREIEERGNEER
jgi:hypothetical protein